MVTRCSTILRYSKMKYRFLDLTEIVEGSQQAGGSRNVAKPIPAPARPSKYAKLVRF
jgi:hypothetical protein